MIDTLRPDHLGCYGYQRDTSPNIDRLASEGVRFEKVISSAPWTNPSILSLFTGLYPSDVWEPKPHSEAIRQALPAEARTMARILGEDGYLTVGASDHPGISPGLFGVGFDIYARLYHQEGRRKGWRETAVDKVLQRCSDLLKERSAGPLFTYIHVLYPHLPYEAPPPYDSMFPNGWWRWSQRSTSIGRYDGEVRRSDDFVGSLLEELERLQLRDGSIVVVLSDHGEGFGAHGQWDHGNTLYNELLAVPLIFWAPDRLPQGTTVPELVRTVDILPTILDLAGIDREIGGRGRSLLPLVDGNERRGRVALSGFAHSLVVQGQAIQSQTDKLIDPNHDGSGLEFYDLDSDPREFDNRVRDESNRVAALVELMDEAGRDAEGRRSTFSPRVSEPSEDTLKRLKSLGYIQ